jgi:alpha-tubulin suppressor-like RCC1 family protein
MDAAVRPAVRTLIAFVCLLVIVDPCSGRMPSDEMSARMGTKRLAAGAEGNHTCFVRADANVVCWGDNTNGQIGDGTSGNVRRQPTPTGITSAVSVAVGKDHSCALLATGSVQCWGSNATGQLGVGSGTTSSSLPVTVPSLSGVVSLVAGTGFTCARKSDGTVRCWGLNLRGQLGDGTTTSPRFSPVSVSGLTDAARIVAGATHACALRGNGAMACWGGNNQGQLGTGNVTDRNIPTPVVDITEFTDMGAGLNFTCALDGDGHLFCWGDNDTAQLGIGSTSNNSNRPTRSSFGLGALDLGAGESHGCFVSPGYFLFCWGANGSGQLGLGTTSPFETSFRGVFGGVLEVTGGRRHSCLLSTTDVVRCWGENALGQLGNTGSDASLQPTGVVGLGGSISARRLAAGANHSCAIRSEASAACWGRSEGGAIGDGLGTDALVPSAVSTAGLESFRAFVRIAGGTNHNCSLVDTAGGSRAGVFAACWGDNREGQSDPIGNQPDFFFTPHYQTFNGFERVDLALGMSAGAFHNCGVNGTHGVDCWGNNDALQLGSVDTTVVLNRFVASLDQVVSVAVGSAHSCALFANGHISCWGSNDFGQLGDGTRTDSATPREVGGITTAVAMSTAADHNCALLVDGTVLCWGRNDFGQAAGALGGDRLVATPVAGIAAGDAAGVTTGSQHSCILTVGGRVRCWGRNNEGQLGNNTLTDSVAPVEVLRAARTPLTLTAIVGLVSTAAHNCALSTTGQPFCWGRNPEGQLGDGTRTRRLLAVGVDSFTANIARNGELAARNRIANVTALVNCPEGERFTGTITLTQAQASGRHPLSGECAGGLSEYPLTLPAQGRDGFVAGEAVAELEIIVSDNGLATDQQRWTRRILLREPAP